MMTPITPMVKQLIIINIIFYIGSNFLIQNDLAYDLFALYFPLNEKFHFWQIITHMFMHAQAKITFTHIVFNMFGLYMFGSALEHFWGAKKFLVFYISCGIGAALLHLGMQYYGIQQLLVNYDLNLSFEQIKILGNINIEEDLTYYDLNEILSKKGIIVNSLSEEILNNYVNVISSIKGSAVGASGALYGITVAFAFMFPNAQMMLLFFPFPIKAKYFVSLLLIYDLFVGISGHSIFGGGGVAHFAHIGGAITGFLIMQLWKNNKFNFKRWN